MVQQLIKLIWTKRSARFESDFDLPGSIARLKAVTRRRVWRSYGPLFYIPPSNIFHGVVAENKVLLHLYPRWPNMSQRLGSQWFRGAWNLREGRIVLKGHFSMYILDKILLTLFFSGLISTFLLGIFSFIPQSHIYGNYAISIFTSSRNAPLVIISGVILVSSYYALKWEVGSSAKSDIDAISERLQQFLSQK